MTRLDPRSQSGGAPFSFHAGQYRAALPQQQSRSVVACRCRRRDRPALVIVLPRGRDHVRRGRELDNCFRTLRRRYRKKFGRSGLMSAFQNVWLFSLNSRTSDRREQIRQWAVEIVSRSQARAPFRARRQFGSHASSLGRSGRRAHVALMPRRRNGEHVGSRLRRSLVAQHSPAPALILRA
jgi:hypothetical protein